MELGLLSDRAKSKGQKLKYRRLPLNIRKHFSIARVTEHWRRLPTEVVVFPSWEILKSHLGQLNLGVPAETVELD